MDLIVSQKKINLYPFNITFVQCLTLVLGLALNSEALGLYHAPQGPAISSNFITFIFNEYRFLFTQEYGYLLKVQIVTNLAF